MWWFPEDPLFSYSLAAMYLLALVNVVSLTLISAPYGKHSRPGWGPTLPSPLAWSLMESPTLFLTLALLLLLLHNNNNNTNNNHKPLSLPPSSLLPLSLFLLHYLHRTFLYPLRLLLLPSPPSPVPFSIALLAFSFNLLNSYLQTRSLCLYPSQLGLPRVAFGTALFLWGMSVNVRSDAALLRLKAEGGGYRLPRGGWFDVVCCPNYMGEVAEWLGWAVVAWTPAALGFFVYTCSNLVPRARQTRLWYRTKFRDDFPDSRWAIIPFLC